MEKTIAKTKVYNVIIMDRSGSMWDIRKPAIMGFNEVLGGVKAAARKYAETQEQLMTLVLFDSTSIDEVYWNANPARVPILTDETYVPGASTPLYDAMGRTLTKLEKELKGDEGHSVVVTVITDGYENDSREYGLAAIKALVEHLKEEGWSFAYDEKIALSFVEKKGDAELHAEADQESHRIFGRRITKLSQAERLQAAGILWRDRRTLSRKQLARAVRMDAAILEAVFH